MHSIFGKLSARKYFHHISQIHDCNLMGTLLDQRNIMTDKSDRNILFSL